jgi:hypothetical protein
MKRSKASLDLAEKRQLWRQGQLDQHERTQELNVDVQDRIDTIETKALGSGRSDVESVGGLRHISSDLWRIREKKPI